MASAGRKPTAGAKRRQTTRAGQGRSADEGTPELQAQKRALTRRTDLPMEPLGILFGRGRIDEAAYRAGLRLEAARRNCFGADTAAARSVYGERLVSGAADQWAARQLAQSYVSDTDARRERQAEGEYDLLLRTLRRCGRTVADATLGIATRPYAGAWLVVALIEPDRPWTARHDTRLAQIREGLAAIDALGSRPL